MAQSMRGPKSSGKVNLHEISNYSWPEEEELQPTLRDPQKGPRLFFRKGCMSMRERFERIFDHSKMLKVMLHGNPHHDNFAGFPNGCGLIDFDRSMVGGYGWDIVRYFAAAIYWSEQFSQSGSIELPNDMVTAFYDWYLEGFDQPSEPFYQSAIFQMGKSKPTAASTASYVASGKKWAKNLQPVEVLENRRILATMLEASLLSNGFGVEKQDSYIWTQYGFSQGSLGNHHHIFLLEHSKLPEKLKLVDIKTTYRNPQTEHYFSPYTHDGLRMIYASKLYAPDLEKGLGYFSHQGRDYWTRFIRPGKQKLGGKISPTVMVEATKIIASQLGRGHRLSLLAVKPSQLTQHLHKNRQNFVDVALRLSRELLDEYHYCLENRAQ